MNRSAFTLRLPPDERAALEALSKIEGRPMNQLANEAIKSFLQQRGPRERVLDESLSRLRAYRLRDPEYRDAIRAFVEAEAGLDDPLEGTVVEGDFVEGEFRPAGPAQSRIRELLSA
jgi:predicted DNA-binding protein